MKIMFDSNAFDKLMESDQGMRFDKKDGKQDEYFITPIQIEELADIPDEKKEKRVVDFLQLCSMGAKLVPVPAIAGYARCGCATIVSEEEATILDELRNDSPKYKKDDLIGTVAKEYDCTIITDDKGFINKLNRCGISTMTFKEWLEAVQS